MCHKVRRGNYYGLINLTLDLTGQLYLHIGAPVIDFVCVIVVSRGCISTLCKQLDLLDIASSSPLENKIYSYLEYFLVICNEVRISV